MKKNYSSKFNYAQVEKYLDDSLIFGIKPNLLRINKILELLGNPHKSNHTDFIHIVGTNGKTSTTIMTAHILNFHGFRSAYHISPHIKKYTERLWFCGRQIRQNEFTQLFNEIYPFILKVNEADLGGPITQFEIIAAMAFWLCFKEKIDVMVLEAGLGGRWDATNAVDSKVVGLTGVSLEHTQILGDTIEKITEEKSKVIKENALVATTTQDEKVLKILKEQTLKTNSILYLYGKDFYITEKERVFLNGWHISLKTIFTSLNNVFLPLLGNYQPLNFSLSAAVSDLYLNYKSKILNEKRVKKALASINIKGRFEILNKRPLVIADTSHNPEGVQNFISNLNEIFNEKDYVAKDSVAKKIIIFSVLKDKDYKKMLNSVIPAADILILTSSNTKRSLPVSELENKFKFFAEKLKIKPSQVYTINNIKDSLDFALKIAASSDIICITGSITNLETII